MLQVILRTHDQGNVHQARRIVDVPKKEVVRRCLLSLNEAVQNLGMPSEVRVFDDHSSKETLALLDSFGWGVESLYQTGNNASMEHAFLAAKACKDDLVYLIEDDFLHFPNALREMVALYYTAQGNGIPQPAVYPYDDFDNYDPPSNIQPTNIVFSRGRHWRTNTYSTCSVLTSPKVFADFWPLWYNMATRYERDNGFTHEGTTINRIWQSGDVTLFTPIPSLAIHMNENQPPGVAWRNLWDRYA